MLQKNINDFMFDNFSGLIEDKFEDIVKFPEDDFREQNLRELIDLVYKSGFKDGLRLIEWLNSDIPL